MEDLSNQDGENEEPINDGKEVFAFDGNEGASRLMSNGELDGTHRTPSGDDRTPKVGMVFKSYEEVLSFFKRYALHVGFGVAVKKSSFTVHGLCRRLVLVCNKWGKGGDNACYLSRPTAKTDCQATIVARLWGDGLLHLVEVNLDHNHTLSPSAARFLRCYKTMPIGMSKDLVGRSAKYGDSCYAYKDRPNFSEWGRLKLSEGEGEAVCQFFTQMQAKQPNFFYLMDFYVEGYMRSVFWADSRSRATYQYFNDVIWIDTTCLRNKFDVPLVSFVGVNHHGQLVLLGCGLLSDESTESYVWLLKSWQICLMACPPNAIITDDCTAIKAAVREVFPNVRHRICLWHVMRSVSEKLKEVSECETIKKELDNLVYDCAKDDDFEEGWRKWMEKFGLEGDEWLSDLYENRHFWAPAFLKDTLWAGMSPVQHTENLSTIFEGSIGPQTSLLWFLSNYTTLLQDKYEMEVRADFESDHVDRIFVSKFHMEEQVSKLYTMNMFKKFQDELEAITRCQVLLIKVNDGSTSTFLVKEYALTDEGDTILNRSFEVVYRADDFMVQCSCGFIHFGGIICRHALSVLKLQQVYEIPSQYLLNRWRKDYKQLHYLDHPLRDVVTSSQLERYDHISMRCLRLVEISMASDEKYQLVSKLINEVRTSLLDESMCRELQRRLSPMERAIGNAEDYVRSQFGNLEGSKVSGSSSKKRRGRPPKKSKERALENSSKDSSRGVMEGSEKDLFHSSSTASNLGTHIQSHGGVDLMEEVNQSELSFGSHFGLANHHHHLNNQLQPGNTLQGQFGQPAVDNQLRAQWIYQQILQEEQAPFSRRTG